MTITEAQILIAVLTFAEGVALAEQPAITEALRVLRPWRSALLRAYLRAESAQSDDAPQPIAEISFGSGPLVEMKD